MKYIKIIKVEIFNYLLELIDQFITAFSDCADIPSRPVALFEFITFNSFNTKVEGIIGFDKPVPSRTHLSKSNPGSF